MRSAFNFRRYVGVMAAIAAMLAVVAGLTNCLAMTRALEITAVPRGEAVDWSRYHAFGKRVGAVQYEHDHSDDFPNRWGLILGHSSAQQGIDPELLGAAYPEVPKWLSVSGSGGSSGFKNLDKHAQILMRSNLRPAVAIIGANALFLCKPAEPPKVDLQVSIAQDLRLGYWSRAIERSFDVIWLIRTRRQFSQWVYSKTQEQRETMAARMGLPLYAVFSGGTSPWTSDFPTGDGQMSQDRFAFRIERAEAIGRFSESSYNESSLDEAVALIGNLDTISGEVILVLFPEHSAFRSRIPARAVWLLTERLPQLAPKVSVMDLRATMNDDEFWDPYHLNRPGRQRFTELLAARLKERSP